MRRGARGFRLARLVVALVIALALAALAAGPAAATITVANTNDSGPGSLRQAIADAGPGETIVLPASASHYSAASAELLISKSLTITGAGARESVIDAMGAPHRVLDITAGPVTISGVTVTGAKEVPGDGAGIEISGTTPVSFSHVSISGNTVKQNSSGGGIYAGGGVTLTVDASTIANNVGYNGGGIEGGTTTLITNSTIFGNHGGDHKFNGDGGGLQNGGSMTLINDTIVGNECFNGGGCGGALFGTATAENTIIAGNLAGNTTDESTVPSDCDIALTSTGPNLEEEGGECGFATHGGIATATPLLGPLANYGGQTDTILPLPGSPAIDAAGSSGCPSADQRGVIRPLGLGCDIGAVEVAPPSAATAAATAVNTSTATLLGAAGEDPAVASGTVFFQFGTSASYGSQTAAQALAAGSSAAPFSAALAGLTPGTVYHFRAVASSPYGMAFGVDRTFVTPVPPSSTGLPPRVLVSNVTQLHSSWRAGNALASVSRKRGRPPLGTTFSLKLDQSATVRFAFAQQLRGRRVKGKCRAATPKNRSRPRCKRSVSRGVLSVPGKSGLNEVAFQGRVSRRVKLAPGSYTAVITAVGANGQRSGPKRLSFTIVR